VHAKGSSAPPVEGRDSPVVVLHNEDHDLVATDECPLFLEESIDDLMHLRPNGDFSCKEGHPYCIEQHKKYCQYVNR
jgi:hypothetical protein